jgi:hypothetical protein
MQHEDLTLLSGPKVVIVDDEPGKSWKELNND